MLDTVVTMFSEYCTPAAFAVEPVDVVYTDDAGAVKEIKTTPVLSTRTVEASMHDIRTLVGVPWPKRESDDARDAARSVARA